MSIDPGDFPLYKNWELTATVNPDFGGENKIFNLYHKESITLTASFEIIEDAPFPEDLKFTIYTYGFKDGVWDTIKNKLKHIVDELDPDNSGSGEFSITILCDGYSKMYAILWIDYWRLGWRDQKIIQTILILSI